MFVAVILCMLISLFALLITVGSILARTGFAKWWGSITIVAWAVTAGAVVLTLSSRAAPAPVDSVAPPLPASSSYVPLDAAASSSTVSSAPSGSMDDVQTGQLLASVLQQLQNGQSIGDEYLNQLPAEKRVQVRAAVRAP